MKELLTEVYRTVKKIAGVDPSVPGNMKQILVNDDAFEAYVTGLAESIPNKTDRSVFVTLAENTRINLIENSMFQINPYETLTLPILRVFYPKLVAKEAITVSPMDKPESIKAFLTASFTPANSSTQYTAPVLSPDISGGPAIGTPVTASMPVPSPSYNVLLLGAGLSNTQAHLERDFVITHASSDGTNYTAVNIVPAVEGHFSSSVRIGLNDDVISGQVNYLAGTVTVASATNVVTSIRYTVTCSLEENRINPAVKLNIDKIRLYAKDRQISANWTINMEQDMRALFDISIQADIVNVLGQQIALDIDRELVGSLQIANARLNTALHTRTFSRNPPALYNWGAKYWHENIITELNVLSAQVYKDTHMSAANTILCNPVDAAILEDIQTFNYTGTSDVDGDLGYRSAVVSGGKWRVLTSAVVAEGQMILTYKPAEEIKCVYIYAPYVPAVLHPYPLGFTPSLTILTRYATALVRSNGIAALTIT